MGKQQFVLCAAKSSTIDAWESVTLAQVKLAAGIQSSNGYEMHSKTSLLQLPDSTGRSIQTSRYMHSSEYQVEDTDTCSSLLSYGDDERKKSLLLLDRGYIMTIHLHMKGELTGLLQSMCNRCF